MKGIKEININDLVSRFDPVAAGQKLLDAVGAQIKEAQTGYWEVAKMIGMPTSRLGYLLQENPFKPAEPEPKPSYEEGFTFLSKDAPKKIPAFPKVLYREEVTRLALVTATPLDTLFSFPKIDVDRSQMTRDERYALREQLPQMTLDFIQGCLAKYDRIHDVFQ